MRVRGEREGSRKKRENEGEKKKREKNIGSKMKNPMEENILLQIKREIGMINERKR